jgi:CPA2 family monovalent cation:H+ antiporter-2
MPAFAVLFFVSVGMLFDPAVILAEPAKLLTVALIVMVGKTVAAMALVLAFRFPLNTALTVGASLAQIGEFSFILAGLGVSLGLLPAAGQNLILGGALISIAANSLLFAVIEPVQQWIRKNSSIARRLEQRAGPLAELPSTTDPNLIHGHIVIVGYGRVGRRIASALDQQGIPYVVIEQNRDVVKPLRDLGVAAVLGDAAETEVLAQAHITDASMLVLATKDTIGAGKIIKTARRLKPHDPHGPAFSQRGGSGVL